MEKSEGGSPFNLRLLEAMASGASSMAASAGSVAELAKDSRAALLWRSGNPWDLARQLERALIDPAVRSRTSSEGRKLAKSRHDVSAYERELARLVLGASAHAAELHANQESEKAAAQTNESSRPKNPEHALPANLSLAATPAPINSTPEAIVADKDAATPKPNRFAGESPNPFRRSLNKK